MSTAAAAELEFVDVGLPAPVGASSTSPPLNMKSVSWFLSADQPTDDDVVDDPNVSLLEELDIDLWDIFFKIRCVILPFRFDRSILMTNPDFWGPFFVVLAYAFVSLWGNLVVLSWIMTFWFWGAAVIYVIARSLGGEVSYGQVLGVLGYSLIPLVLMVALEPFLGLLGRWAFLVGRGFSVFWAAFSAGSLLVTTETLARRKSLLLYPLCLLFCYFVSLHSGA
eukprot:c1708_g1_i1.p1 GENE.c1708_g1_i1~~c1708_g1_i1.p1  ORF type:complete len:223 (-),score=40.75 c1708_g1_i1:13-681(-)